jgi:pyrroloquinoline quinone biosynthesis protein B
MTELVFVIFFRILYFSLSPVETVNDTPFIVVLGNVQDGGSPHMGCKKDCCSSLFENPDRQRMVVSLGLVFPDNSKTFLFEATPDISRQNAYLNKEANRDLEKMPDGVFLTHAHIGHYTGLMYFGKEAKNSRNVDVFAMPRMFSFLSNNGPWNQLVKNENISLKGIYDEMLIKLSSNVTVEPLKVPHRDEYSETVGYRISGPNKKVLFIPDIDKWEKWDRNIILEIQKVDYAFIDATFYDSKEVNYRNISEIPHPFVSESIKQFENESNEFKEKVFFIHFNHTNPLLDVSSLETRLIKELGFNIARFGDIVEL